VYDFLLVINSNLGPISYRYLRYSDLLARSVTDGRTDRRTDRIAMAKTRYSSINQSINQSINLYLSNKTI